MCGTLIISSDFIKKRPGKCVVMINTVYKVRGIDPAHGETFTVYVLAYSTHNARWVAFGLLRNAGWRGGYMESEYALTLERAERDG